MSVEEHMQAVTDAARIVRARLPKSNPIELCDLVQAGAERVQRYLSGRPGGVSRTLVFICAKGGMLEEARRWVGLPPDKRVRVYVEPRYCPIEEWHRCFWLDVEMLIDVKRTLLRMPLREAASWYSRHMLDEPVGTLGNEFGVGRGSICLYEIAARKKLRDALSAGEQQHRSQARIMGTAALQRHAVERERYAELRRMGATVRHATRAAKSPSLYACAVRQLTAEAAE